MRLIIEQKDKQGIWSGIICTFILSCFYFPFAVNFLPHSINSKIILAVFGALFFVIDSILTGSIHFSKKYVPSFLMVFVFSLVCFFSTDINYTEDYSYATYFVSFFVWLFAAYSCVKLMKLFYKRVGFDLIIYYLAIVCVFQCIFSLVIFNVPSVKLLVDTYISQSTVVDDQFLQKINRLYGIGAALDPAGTRFSIVLIAVASILARNLSSEKLISRNKFLWVAFLIISVIGNLMSRTTMIGVGLGLGLLLLELKLYKLVIEVAKLRQYLFMFFMFSIFILIAFYYYINDVSVRSLIRYGFEGFFNWWELGVWKTNSTELLLDAWVWPSDRQGWIIGYGLFDNWIFDTDIGYCRFIMYSGVSGLVCFSLFFIFNAYVGALEFPNHKFFFFILLCLSFIIWIKVSTDLFVIYALFFVIDKPMKNEDYL